MKYVLVVALLFLFACSSKDPFKRMGKLSGIWQTDTGEGILYEEWTKSRNNIMYGKSYMVDSGDSLVFERIELVKRDSGIFYIPVVKDQNKDLPVSFRMTNATDSSFVFENRNHDFPQRIIYRFVTNDSIVARIEGDVKGAQRSMEFYYRRVQ